MAIQYAYHVLERYAFEPLAHVLQHIASPTMLAVPDRSSSLKASWFLSPKQHAIEFLIFNLIILSSLYYCMRRAYKECLPQIEQFLERRRLFCGHQNPPPTLIERGLRLGGVISISAMIIYKMRNGSWWFLAQPCHVDIIVFLAMTYWADSRKPWTHFAFNLMIHHSWGAIMAIVQPDFRDYWQFLEVEMFWLEHFLVLLIPAYCIYSYRFHFLRFNPSLVLASFLLIAAYHSAVLSVLALVSGNNLNYITSPPLGPLELFGKNYRVAMYLFCLPVTVFTRAVLWEAAHKGMTSLQTALPVSAHKRK